MDAKQKLADLGVLVGRFHREGKFDKALEAALQAADLTKMVFGGTHPEYARSLSNVAVLYFLMGEYGKAEPFYKKSLEIQKAVLGENHPDYANSLTGLAVLYRSMGEYGKAEPLYKKSLEIQKAVLGENHPDYALNLNSLAGVYSLMGVYGKAEPLYKKSLEIQKAVLGENHPHYAVCLSDLAAMYKTLGEYRKAEPLYKKSLEINKRVLGENHPEYAKNLNSLAVLYDSMGDYGKAEPLYKKSLEIRKVVLGEKHPDYANSLTGLALMFFLMGEYGKAEPLYKKSLEIRKVVLGENHPDYAKSLSDLAGLYDSMGDYGKAEPLHKKSLEIRKAVLGEKHPDYAKSLNNLAGLYTSMGEYGKAEPLYKKSLEIQKAVLGEKHPEYATNLNNLAVLYEYVGDYGKAEPLHKKSLEIRKAVLGEKHPDYAKSLNNLAGLYTSMGEYGTAEPLHKKSLEIRKAVLGEKHPDYVNSLNNLARLYISTGKVEQGLILIKEAAMASDTLIGQVFSISSEDQKLKYLESMRPDVDIFISLVFQYFRHSPPAVQDALSLILRRKSITAEAMAVQRDAILGGKYPHLQDKLKQLKYLQMQIAQKTLAGPGREGIHEYQRLLSEWTNEKEYLETELSRQIPEMRLAQNLQNADRRVIAHSLPPATTLVEFFRYTLFDFTAVVAKGETRWKPARYCAFVLPKDEPEAVAFVDLGEADLIDHLIGNYKSRLTGEGRAFGVPAAPGQDGGIQNLKPPERSDRLQLYSALITPLQEVLGNCDCLILAPDGQLSLLPFEVIPTPDGGYLINHYRISYVGVGRDILRFTTALPVNPGNSLIMASPDFDLQARPGQVSPNTSTIPGRMSRDFSRSSLHFSPLPGTKTEGKQIGALLGVQPLLDATALESRLKSAASPLILHIATHGFFQNDRDIPSQKNIARDFGTSLQRLAGPLMENPMLRSGIALAGANTWLENGNLPPDAEDGILTAEDVTGLDLIGTSLAVLSACETGMGDVKCGEGVFGLRRAFALAGAKTLIMSLWKVPDTPTQELMVDFYRRLLAGTPKADALREAQMEIRKKYPHPQDWGAFICQGDPGPVSGTGTNPAEQVFKKSLEIKKAVPRENPPDNAISVNSLAESETRPDREAWIIKLKYSVDSGKNERYCDGSILTEYYTSYNRVVHPAKCEKKILKNIGYETTLDNLIQVKFNTGHRTMTGVIIADHIAKKVYLCKTPLFLNHDLTCHQQVDSMKISEKPWWFGVPLITSEYLVPALSRPELAHYSVLEVDFIIEEKTSFGIIKQDPVLHIVESSAANEVMALFSRPASTVTVIILNTGNPVPPIR